MPDSPAVKHERRSSSVAHFQFAPPTAPTAPTATAPTAPTAPTEPYTAPTAPYTAPSTVFDLAESPAVPLLPPQSAPMSFAECEPMPQAASAPPDYHAQPADFHTSLLGGQWFLDSEQVPFKAHAARTHTKNVSISSYFDTVHLHDSEPLPLGPSQASVGPSQASAGPSQAPAGMTSSSSALAGAEAAQASEAGEAGGAGEAIGGPGRHELSGSGLDVSGTGLDVSASVPSSVPSSVPVSASVPGPGPDSVSPDLQRLLWQIRAVDAFNFNTYLLALLRAEGAAVPLDAFYNLLYNDRALDRCMEVRACDRVDRRSAPGRFARSVRHLRAGVGGVRAARDASSSISRAPTSARCKFASINIHEVRRSFLALKLLTTTLVVVENPGCERRGHHPAPHHLQGVLFLVPDAHGQVPHAAARRRPQHRDGPLQVGQVAQARVPAAPGQAPRPPRRVQVQLLGGGVERGHRGPRDACAVRTRLAAAPGACAEAGAERGGRGGGPGPSGTRRGRVAQLRRCEQAATSSISSISSISPSVSTASDVAALLGHGRARAPPPLSLRAGVRAPRARREPSLLACDSARGASAHDGAGARARGERVVFRCAHRRARPAAVRPVGAAPRAPPRRGGGARRPCPCP
ncbi:hypothetical protein CLUG_02132 [Clavispora lusitaniae ATCC 42720]|uniref:Uncharacterized protein n=1 Tax=Clavispora lusitaniae (strain ATCC 42720) TaxID=306902 RepID=C4Y1Q0_CLAL4|nr:uncharacterized protein CLUG_02132 [Clavispora lusitaniae ATCC 42720]EEQ38008.1 hypothetical protein CLUG_02132 [Clavispora lusitaniae ATCC 42720]